jgi:ATP-dependent exoDNAse (exonuclease V) beta subunit
VALKPKRDDCTDEPAVMRWTMRGDEEARAAALASAVADFVRSEFSIVDRDSREVRPVRWGDIALPAATNNQVETIARALRAAHVPVKMTLSGLLAVPEVCLAKACLRRLNDSGDTLATAEIISMSDCVEAETWLADRLKHLERDDDSLLWAEAEHPVVAKLAALRETIGMESPVEVTTRVLKSVGIREVVTAWGPNPIEAMQRQRNLDALLHLAVEYEGTASRSIRPR